MRHSRLLALVLLVSFALKLALLLWVGDIKPFRDEIHYLSAGSAIAHGEPIHYDDALWDELHAPPMYPWFVAAVMWLGGGAFEIKLLQVLLSTLSAWFVYRLGRSWYDERVGLLGAAIFAFYPTLVAFTHYNWNETVFLFWFSLGLWVVAPAASERAPASRLLMAGLVFGLAALTRAIVLYLLPVLVVWIYAWGRDRRLTVRNGSLLAVGFVVALLPRTISVYGDYDGFMPLGSSAAYGWYVSYNYFEPANADWGFHQERNTFRQYLLAVKAGKEPRKTVVESNPILRTRAEKRRAIEFLLEHPLLFARHSVMRVVELLNPTSFAVRHVRLGLYEHARSGERIRDPLPRWALMLVIAATAGSYVVLASLVVLALLSLASTPARTLVLLVMPAFFGLHALTFGMSRYRLIMLPLVAVVAAAFLLRFDECRERLLEPRRAIAAAAILALLLVVWSLNLDKL